MATVILKPGEKLVLPYGATVTSVVEGEGGVALSTCDSINVLPKRCWDFYWEFPSNADGPDSLDAIIVGDLEYPIQAKIDEAGNFAGFLSIISPLAGLIISLFSGQPKFAEPLVKLINEDPVLSASLKAYCPCDVNQKYRITISIPDNGHTPEIRFLNTTSTDVTYPFYIKGTPSENCYGSCSSC